MEAELPSPTILTCWNAQDRDGLGEELKESKNRIVFENWLSGDPSLLGAADPKWRWEVVHLLEKCSSDQPTEEEDQRIANIVNVLFDSDKEHYSGLTGLLRTGWRHTANTPRPDPADEADLALIYKCPKTAETIIKDLDKKAVLKRILCDNRSKVYGTALTKLGTTLIEGMTPDEVDEVFKNSGLWKPIYWIQQKAYSFYQGQKNSSEINFVRALLRKLPQETVDTLAVDDNYGLTLRMMPTFIKDNFQDGSRYVHGVTREILKRVAIHKDLETFNVLAKTMSEEAFNVVIKIALENGWNPLKTAIGFSGGAEPLKRLIDSVKDKDLLHMALEASDPPLVYELCKRLSIERLIQGFGCFSDEFLSLLVCAPSQTDKGRNIIHRIVANPDESSELCLLGLLVCLPQELVEKAVQGKDKSGLTALDEAVKGNKPTVFERLLLAMSPKAVIKSLSTKSSKHTDPPIIHAVRRWGFRVLSVLHKTLKEEHFLELVEQTKKQGLYKPPTLLAFKFVADMDCLGHYHETMGQEAFDQACLGPNVSVVQGVFDTQNAKRMLALKKLMSPKAFVQGVTALDPPLLHTKIGLLNLDFWKKELPPDTFKMLCWKLDSNGMTPLEVSNKFALSDYNQLPPRDDERFTKEFKLQVLRYGNTIEFFRKEDPEITDMLLSDESFLFVPLEHAATLLMKKLKDGSVDDPSLLENEDFRRESLIRVYDDRIALEEFDKVVDTEVTRYDVYNYRTHSVPGYILSKTGNERHRACDYFRHGPPEQVCFLNPGHFAIPSGEVNIPPPPDIDINKLVKLFDTINFDDENLPGYKDPTKIVEEKSTLTTEELREHIKRYVSLTTAREHFQAVPKDAKESEQYFDRLNAMAQHVTQHLIKLTQKAEKEEDYSKKDLILADRNEILLSLAIAGQWCGVRFMGTTQQHAIPLFAGEDAASVESLVRTLSANLRFQCLRKAMGEEGSLSAHTYNRYMFLLGEDLGLTGGGGAYADELYSGKITKELACKRFDFYYTTASVIRAFDAAINATLTRKKEFNPDLIADWFKDHLPQCPIVDDPMKYIEDNEIPYQPITAEQQIEKSRRKAFAKTMPKGWDPDKTFAKLLGKLEDKKPVDQLKIVREGGISPRGPDIKKAVEEARSKAYQKTISEKWDTDKGFYSGLIKQVDQIRRNNTPEAVREKIRGLLPKNIYKASLDPTPQEAIEADWRGEQQLKLYTPQGRISRWAIAELLCEHGILQSVLDPSYEAIQHLLAGEMPELKEKLKDPEMLVDFLSRVKATTATLSPEQNRVALLSLIIALDTSAELLAPYRRQIDKLLNRFVRNLAEQQPQFMESEELSGRLDQLLKSAKTHRLAETFIALAPKDICIVALREGDPDTFEMMLACSNEAIKNEAQNMLAPGHLYGDGTTLIERAIRNDCVGLVRAASGLLRDACIINLKKLDNEGVPLLYSLLEGELSKEMEQALLDLIEEDLDSLIEIKNDRGLTLLHAAAKAGPKRLRALVERDTNRLLGKLLGSKMGEELIRKAEPKVKKILRTLGGK